MKVISKHKKSQATFLITLFFAFSLAAQVSSKLDRDVNVSSATVTKLGHSEAIRSLKKKSRTPESKREQNRRFKKVPDNFKGRNGKSKTIHHALEHQGPDPIRQSSFRGQTNTVEPIVNINGIGDSGSPHDPSGDVSDEFYVQMINGTDVAVYDLEGVLIETFDANTLWSEFSQSSAGDPIVLYDENVDRWILTEFADPANVLIAISDDGDPLGGYTAYNFSTPNFPDYPKYALSPEILTFTSNEEDGSVLHNYFIDLTALYAGDQEVRMQRIELSGNAATEAGFYVTTPVDWNGTNLPFDNRPVVLNLNDSSWPGGPAQDQIEVYTFDINFDDENATQVTQDNIITTPFDSYPCSETGFGFACIPQKDGSGLDGIPEVIMNIPHMRNFTTHESIVFSFITDATDGDNRSGIRWMEIRRSESDTTWQIHQEGTFAPDDGLDRFMPSIAIDAIGNIGLAYNVSSSETYVGAKFTGRKSSDPLGVMTFDEYNIVDGVDVIRSGERFGDYSQMSVSPRGDNTFWWTSEYAGNGSRVTQTRIVAFKINKDTFDLALRSIDNPVTSAGLSTSEQVSATVLNSGLEPISNYKLDLFFRGELIETNSFTDTLFAEQSTQITFDTLLDLSLVNIYDIAVAVSNPLDQNPLNDTLGVSIRQLHDIDAGISGQIQQENCTSATLSTLRLTNNGALPIDSAAIMIQANDIIIDTIQYVGSLSYTQSAFIEYEVLDLEEGENNVIFKISSVNGGNQDGNSENNEIALVSTNLPADHFITLEFTTDDYPEETYWEIMLQGSNDIIASGGFTEEATLFTETICVDPDSCYTFVVTDSENDGICCGFGTGFFDIFDNQGILLVSNDGDFGSSTTENFCATAIECTLEITVSSTDATGENAEDGIIFAEASSGIAPYQYSIDGGITFQDTATFTGLAPGDYTVIVKDDSGSCEQMSEVSIGFPSSIDDLNEKTMKVSISPNPTSDVFKLTIENHNIDDAQLSVQILNISGQIIQERKIGKYSDRFLGTFSLMDYPAGTYLIRIKHDEVNFMDKVIRLSN